MAQSAPACRDTQDFQFKLRDKFVAFKKCGEPRSNVKLLAISSSRGLLFVGSPTHPELKVIIVKDLANAKSTGQQPQARLVPLPSVPNYIACSSDGNLLAVNHTQNGTSLLSIYTVPSFMTPDVRPVYSIRLAAEDHVHAVQLLWNPVLPNSLAVVLSNGALGMYALKEGGNFEMHSLDKNQQVKCGCWSPKGKQIVLGFPGGKVQQFKPDLTPAKTLMCPPNVHDAPFDTIAIQWLSTFQFAVVFLQHGEDCNPALYIVNAPKAGTPSYINYYDICYSLNGPRNHQFLFNHVPQWNLLLVISANGVEVGVMGTSEAGDTPAWQQLTLLDEARIEMPLSEATQEETFPLGFVYDTSTTHQLIINEQKIQTMPMVHVLGSDGDLLSFDFLNMLPNAVSVCSPPPPVADTSGQFRPLNTLLPSEEEEQPAAAASPPPKTPAVSAPSDISFAFTPNTVTSTPAPAKDKPPSLFSGFGAAAAKAPAPQLSFGSAPIPAPQAFAASTVSATKPAIGFGGFGAPTTTPAIGSMFSAPGANAFGGMAINKQAAVSMAPRMAPESTAHVAAPVNKPLYTVPPTFAPVATKPTASAPPVTIVETFRPDDTEPIIKDMIALQIESFSQDIEKQKDQTKDLLKGIAAPSALRVYAKRLDDLQELNEQAKDVEFELDVQGLRQGLNEAYAIVAECRGKLEIYRKPDITRLMNSSSCDPAGRRMLARLQSYVAANEAQLRLAQQHVDVQWEQFQDVVRRNSKSRMHMPCLEGIYQRLTRLQNLTSDQRILQNNIKAKLKERGLLQTALLDQENSRTRTNEAVDTLADSILSMSLSHVVDSNAAKLTQQRLQKIRKVVQLQKVNIICPQRPDRVGLKSEVILETKRRAEQIKKTAAKPTTANKFTQVAVAPPPTPAPAAGPMPLALPTVASQLPKPMPSKPLIVEKSAVPILPTTSAATPFSFSQSSPFVKTSTVTPTTNTVTPGEAAKPGLSMFGGMGSASSSFSFGGSAKTALSFGGGSPAVEAAPMPKPNLSAGVGKDQPATEPAKPKEQKGGLEIKPVIPAAETTKVQPQTPKAEVANKSFGFGGFTGTGGAVGSASSSPFSFGGLGSSLGFGGAAPAVPKSEAPKSNATTAAAATSASASPFSMFSAALTKTTTSEPTVTSSTTTTTVTSKPTPASGSTIAAEDSSEKTASGVTSSSDPIGGLFSSVNICKPNTPTDSAKPVNIFGSLSSGSGSGSFSFDGGDASKGLFGGTTQVATTTTPATTVADATIKTDPITTTATAVPTVATTSASSATTVPSAATPAVPPSTTALVTSSNTVPGSAFSFSNAFSSLSAGGPGAAPSTTSAAPLLASSSTASTASNASSSVFGGGFEASTSTVAPVVSPFQTAPKSSAPSGNIFGTIPKPETSVFGAASVAPSNTPAAPTGAAPPTGLFASAAISNPSPFGSPPSGAAASGGNIFGQAAKSSVFGQPAPATGPAGGGSIFGGATNVPFGSSSIFGGSNPQSPVSAPAAGSASIFGQSVFSQSAAGSPAAGGNIFSNTVGTPQALAFGGGGSSIFGSPAPAAASPVSGGSIFGGGSSSGGFGSFSQTTPAQGGFGGGFAQGGGGSVAQTGFGSPQTPQQQPAPGGFGAKPVFGGSPAFGASPTFGGGPTFGSPKGFGGFGGATPVASPPAFGAAPKPAEGNIFETLGGQESGLSFGNLAQTGNSNAQKPAFGGSSFMNYR